MRQVFEIGALHRRPFRAACFSLGLATEEHNRIVDSIFHVSGPDNKMGILRTYVAQIAEREAEADRRFEEAERRFRAARRWYNPWTWFR